MKVIYIFRSGNSLSGVHRKVNSQMQLLRANGVNCVTHNICSGCPQINNNNARTFAIPDYTSRIKILNKFKRELFVIAHLGDQISSLNSQDIIYMRIPYPSFFLSRLLSQKRACKIVIEHQSIEPLEYRSIEKYWYLFIDYLFGDAIRMYSDGIVGVTDEITQYELMRAGNPKKPNITIGNGYDVESVTVRNPPILSDKNLDLLCVSSVKPWHGVDRLIRGLAIYRGPKKVTLHIAGEGPELPRIKKISCRSKYLR